MGFWKLKIHADQFNIGQGFWAQGEYALGCNDITYSIRNSKTSSPLLKKWLDGPWINPMLEYGEVEQHHNITERAIYSVDTVQFVAQAVNIEIRTVYNNTIELGA